MFHYAIYCICTNSMFQHSFLNASYFYGFSFLSCRLNVLFYFFNIFLSKRYHFPSPLSIYQFSHVLSKE